MPGTTLARGNVLYEKIFAVTIAPTAIGGNTTLEQTFTVLGVQPNDYINSAYSAAQTVGIIIGNVRISAVNTIAIQFANVTAGSLTPVAGAYGFIWGRPENLPLDGNAL